ncbi:redoxin domain-containing protein [Aquimarina spongiae]|uniref:Thiol-disulfide isomerase or thioredoxin n=1 Tax=Aquimarina spongiae TaxID=570521 RepID=A0A1M6CB89_9FLAO|nr:redoxin domain-containing protein [Aquimarina spongiae]SHI58282.1 Thiol-disulfide isomerase or thioredoxin [Aquimarina spongiae]
MRKLLILGILFSFCSHLFAQEEVRIPFSVAISAHIVKYNQKMDEAYRQSDLERATFLFDSLVTNHLNGTYMDDFTFNTIKEEPITFKEYEKPIFLITYAAWCVPGIGEIPALNDLADRFHDQIDFVVLFWDTKENLKDKSDDYSKNIQMVYVDEKTNQDSYIVNKLKHALGFPMMYFLDEEKKLLNIQKIETHHSSETLSNSYNIHFNSLSKGVSLIIADLDRKGLLKDDTDTEALKEKEAEDEEVGEDGRTAEERRIDEEYEKYKREKDSLRNLLRDKN